MKLNVKVDKDTINKVQNWFAGSWPTLLIVATIIGFTVLSYMALYPKLDPGYISDGMAKVKELDIRFDTKLIEELGATKQPSELKASGGRDPFAGY